jgi:hypothetical protein
VDGGLGHDGSAVILVSLGKRVEADLAPTLPLMRRAY